MEDVPGSYTDYNMHWGIFLFLTNSQSEVI